jgi:hypothetical protein
MEGVASEMPTLEQFRQIQAASVGAAASTATDMSGAYGLDQLGLIEVALAKIGLTSPARRFAAGTIVTTGLIWAFKPSALFDESGKAKEWAATSKKGNATLVPWWAYPLSVGIYLSVFL